MKPSRLFLAVSACLGVSLPSSPVDAAPPGGGITGEYQIVESSNPGGESYRGKVAIEPLGVSYRLRWTPEKGDTYGGPAILLNGVLGAGYGDGLTGLAVYEIKGGTLKAKWLLADKPMDVGEYELSGPPGLNGSYKFKNGYPGGVTIKPNGKNFDMVWKLPSGTFAGIGVRVNDVLVAVSGTNGAGLGVAAYRGVGDHVEGVWTVPGQTLTGTEKLVKNSAPLAASSPAPTPGNSPPIGGGATAKPGGKAETSNEELAGKIAADMKVVTGIAGNFLALLAQSKLEEAAALIAEEGLAQMKTTRQEFLAKLRQNQTSDGRMLDFTPNRDKVNFGAEAGGIFFSLEGDSKCEKIAAHEKMRFFRFPDGKIKMVGYQRVR